MGFVRPFLNHRSDHSALRDLLLRFAVHKSGSQVHVFCGFVFVVQVQDKCVWVKEYWVWCILCMLCMGKVCLPGVWMKDCTPSTSEVFSEESGVGGSVAMVKT